MKRLTYLLLFLILAVTNAGASQPFDVKALHIDLRAEVMTMQALKQTAKNAAAEGLNTIIMEWEANFPFDDNATICGPNAYTKEEVKDFISYCSSLGLDVIPLQNCFGHAEYILRHDRYSSLRESSSDFSQVCPLKIAQCTKAFESIFKEIAEMHPSKYIHIGADETRLLGACKDCSKKSKSDLFVDYVCAMCDIVKKLGKTPIIWADMILTHPEAADRLPKDLILLDWNYGWKTDRFGDIENLQKKGFTMWGACALRSHPDDIMLTCWGKHFGNLQDYVAFCHEKGFKGIVETSWSTSGQYGYLKGAYETIDIQPIREVYPMSAFNILISAFAKAAKEDKRLDTNDFIRRYAKKNFGLNDEGAMVVEDFMFMTQETVNNALQLEVIEKELQKATQMSKRLGALNPRKNLDEWNQWLLSLDIRAHYLKYKKVENIQESPTFNNQEKKNLQPQIDELKQEAQTLRERFVKLNGWYLKDPEAPLGDWSYIHKLR